MKFNCGLSKQEKYDDLFHEMIRRNKNPQWVKKFAWFPVRVGRKDCRWLEYVEVQYTDWYVWKTFTWGLECGLVKYRAINQK